MNILVPLAFMLLVAFAASATTIRIDPPSTSSFAKQNVDLNVRISDVADLYTWQFSLAFDPAVLFAVSVSEGTFLSSGGTTFFIPGEIDNTAGTITFTADTLLGPTGGVSGSGTLATIRFRTVWEGTSPVALSNVGLLDSALADISTEVQNGSVTVVIPEPASLFASGIGLALLGGHWLRHRRR